MPFCTDGEHTFIAMKTEEFDTIKSYQLSPSRGETYYLYDFMSCKGVVLILTDDKDLVKFSQGVNHDLNYKEQEYIEFGDKSPEILFKYKFPYSDDIVSLYTFNTHEFVITGNVLNNGYFLCMKSN